MVQTVPLTLSFTAGSDYNQPMVTTVTFGPDQTSASYPVPIVDDSNIEDTETFTATLSNTESNVTIVDDIATVTILDEDSELFTVILVACKVITVMYGTQPFFIVHI